MPPGSLDAEACGNGKYTGLIVAQQIRRSLPYTPIMLLSNTTFSDVEDACRATQATIPNCLFWQKQEMNPSRLASKLDEYFDSGKMTKPQPSLLQRIFGMVLLQPNVAGIGIDLKKVGPDKSS